MLFICAVPLLLGTTAHAETKQQILAPWLQAKCSPSAEDLTRYVGTLGGGFYYSVEHQFIFIKIAKNGGTTTVATLTRHFCPNWNSTGYLGCITGTHTFGCDYQNASLDCSKEVNELVDLWPRAIVFAVFREPLDRAESMYYYSQCNRVVSFTTNAVGPGFLQDPHQCKHHGYDGDTHTLSTQRDMFYLPSGCPLFDVAVQLEHLEFQLQGVMAMIARRNQNATTMAVVTTNVNQRHTLSTLRGSSLCLMLPVATGSHYYIDPQSASENAAALYGYWRVEAGFVPYTCIDREANFTAMDVATLVEG